MLSDSFFWKKRRAKGVFGKKAIQKRCNWLIFRWWENGIGWGWFLVVFF